MNMHSMGLYSDSLLCETLTSRVVTLWGRNLWSEPRMITMDTMTPRSLTRSEQDSVETLRDRLLPGWAWGVGTDRHRLCLGLP